MSSGVEACRARIMSCALRFLPCTCPQAAGQVPPQAEDRPAGGRRVIHQMGRPRDREGEGRVSAPAGRTPGSEAKLMIRPHFTVYVVPMLQAETGGA